MKKSLILVFSITNCLLFGQKDTSRIKILEQNFVDTDIYYINTQPKIVRGQFFTGVDSVYFTSADEKFLAVETFVNGFKVELKTYYDNGNPEKFFQWKDGKRNGISRGWYKNGNLFFDTDMQNDKPACPAIMFYENGNPSTVDDLGKSGIFLEFYENGRVRKMCKNVNDSLQCGGEHGFEETMWHENGQLLEKSIGNCGKQSFTWYYNDSSISSRGTLIGMDLFLVGDYTNWYRNGKLKMEAHYSDSSEQNGANVKTGVWKYYREDGKLETEEIYEQGQLIQTIDHSNSKVKRLNGKRNPM